MLIHFLIIFMKVMIMFKGHDYVHKRHDLDPGHTVPNTYSVKSFKLIR